MSSMLYISFFFRCVVKAVAHGRHFGRVMSNDNNKINEMAISFDNFLELFLVRCLVFTLQ